MAKKTEQYGWARSSRRVIPLDNHRWMYLSTEFGKTHHIEATPEEVARVLEGASDEYRDVIRAQLKAENFLIPVNEVETTDG